MNRQGMSYGNINVDKLQAGGERNKSHGNFFHWQQLMLFSCKSVVNNISFEATCEVQEAGKFDDFMVFYKHGEETRHRLVQVKHKEDSSKLLTFKDLNDNKKKDFHLKTYFDSYVKIKNDVHFHTTYRGIIDELVICTNTDFDDDLKTYLEPASDSPFNEVDLYRVKSSKITEFTKKILNVENNNDFQDFLNKLRFAIKQSDEDVLKKNITCEIDKCLEKTHPKGCISANHIETIYDILLVKIISFATTKKVQIITDKIYAKWLQQAFKLVENQLFVHHRHNVYNLFRYQIRFEDNSLNNIEKFVQEGRCLLKVVACASTDFTVKKIIQIFNEQNKEFCLIFDDQVITNRTNIKEDFLSVDQCEYLIIICKSNRNSDQVFEIVRDIRDDINKGSISNKRIVLVSSPEVESRNYDDLTELVDHVEWNDLDKQTKDHVLKKQIVFQGQPVPFSFIDISQISIRDRDLSEIVLSEKFEIGKPFHDSKTDNMSYFVRRNVRLYDEIINPFEIHEVDHLFAIENIDESHFDYYKSSVSLKDRSRYFRLNDKSAAEEFQKISRDNVGKNVSWIHFKDRMFHQKKSNCSISDIKQYIKYVPRKIELGTVLDIENKSVLVIGEPGMGKSTLLSSLATQSIKRSPNVWVVKIDLNNHTRYFYDIKERHGKFSKENDVIKFIIDTQKFVGFEKALFESYFRIENKLVVLLDGFDEIAPHYKEIVVDLVKILKSANKITVWITSRPHETVFLKEQLDILSYSLFEFTGEDQRQFFRKYWKKHVDKTYSQKDRLETFVDRLLEAISKSLCTVLYPTTSNPLHCKMLADVYNDDFIKFYENQTDDTGIKDTVDIFDLYGRFIKIRCKINVEEKRGIDSTRPENVTVVDDEIEKLTSKYKLLSLGVVFGEEDSKMLLNEESKNIIVKSLSDIENGVDKCGIVCSVENGTPIFVHRTFAEYFAAMYLRDNNCIAFVRSKLSESKYTVVRRFFDRLTATYDIFKYVLNGDKELLQKELENDREAIYLTDKFGRNVLHLIAGYDDTLDICKYLVESGADTTRVDELFGSKPVEYAVSLKLWGNADELIVGNENDETILTSIENKKKIMCTAGENGWIRLLRYLIEIGKMSVDTEDENGLSVLHFAASEGHIQTCEYLIENGANIKKCLDCENKILDIFYYETSFHIAIEKGFIEIVKLFIENDKNIIEDIRHKETLLHAAMESGNVEILRILVNHGANVNSVNKYGETPLQIARKDTDVNAIDILLQKGASIEVIDYNRCTPLMRYVRVGNISVARHLLAKGANIYHCDEYNNTALHYAVSNGRLNILEMLIAHDPNIVKKIPSSKTLLHSAMKFNKIEIIELLIINGAGVNGRNENCETPLHIARSDTSTEVIDILLSHGVNIDATDRSGKTPLIKYAKEGNSSVVRLLLTKGANTHHCPENDQTVLHCAASIGDLNLVKILITHDTTIMKDANVSETVLHAAMESNKVEIIEVLIKHGANVNGRNSNYETPLHIANSNTSTEIIDTLSSYGADIDPISHDGSTPLIKFVEFGNFRIVERLVALGADIHHCPENGQTVLHHAVSIGDLNLIKMLIAYYPTIMEDIKVTETVLHVAMKLFNIEIIEVLIRHGANVNGRNSNDETPLHIASWFISTEIIDVLLSHGANINATDRSGNTPLIKYTEKHNLSVVQLLLAKRANIHHCPENGQTVLHCAASIGDLNLVKMLITHDATIMKDANVSETVLHASMESNNVEIIEVLIKHGANVNGRNSNDETPLHIANSNTSTEIIDTLLRHGADIDTMDAMEILR